MLLSLPPGWALLRGRSLPVKLSWPTTVPASCRSGEMTSPAHQAQHPSLLAAEQAAQGTGFGSLVFLRGREVSGSGLQRPGPQSQLEPPEQRPPWLRGRLESLGAEAPGAGGSSRAGRASRGRTAPWPGRCARAGGGSGT